jgi:tetratricopeptide (TPR) repeat protein
MGMDVDGPDGDKGMYAIKTLSKQTVIESGDVITWNSFTEKPKDHKTIGFMSRVSPDGRYVASTLNEALYVSNFMQFEFLQVFFPTRGILAYYSRDDDEIRALPGADDPEFVHCSPAWTPDGGQIVFSRARAFDPWKPGQVIAKHPNDPNEPQIRYDLYRMPFNGGKGGEPVPVKGASDNGMSNTFPKVSPDGKWIVWTKCKNGLLMRPDSRLWIVPVEGGEPREMRCNTRLMNSWHSFSPNGRWMVFSSKSNTPYTQAFLTHLDEDGNDSPAILIPNCTAANRAVNLPEFLNAGFDDLDRIEVPVVRHHAYAMTGERQVKAGDTEAAIRSYRQALKEDPTFVRALINLGYALMQIDRHDQALLHLERACREDPRNLFALYNMELCYLRTGRPHLALRTLDRLLAIAPEYPGAKEDRARAAAEAAALAGEIARLEDAQQREPDNPSLEITLAEMYRRAGRLEDCVRRMERALEIVPDDPRIPARLAWLLATNPDDRIRDAKRAVKLAARAVELSKGERPEPLDIAAAAYAEAGEWEKAAEAADRAIVLAKKLAPQLAVEIERRRELIANREPIRTASDR